MQNLNQDCDNLDLKTTPEGLNKKFDVNLLGRKSYRQRSHEIKINKIKVFSNILTYLFEVKNALKNKDSRFLIISISPYTFLISIFIRILGQKPIVYLRSDGYKEYRSILGFYGSFIYHIMFILVEKFTFLTKNSVVKNSLLSFKISVCNDRSFRFKTAFYLNIFFVILGYLLPKRQQTILRNVLSD